MSIQKGEIMPTAGEGNSHRQEATKDGQRNKMPYVTQ